MIRGGNGQVYRVPVSILREILEGDTANDDSATET